MPETPTSIAGGAVRLPHPGELDATLDVQAFHHIRDKKH
jgi:hypothetical protein